MGRPGKLMAGCSDAGLCLCFAGEFGFEDINSLDFAGTLGPTTCWLEVGRRLTCEQGDPSSRPGSASLGLCGFWQFLFLL